MPTAPRGGHAGPLDKQGREAAEAPDQERLRLERRATEAAERQAQEAVSANGWTRRNYSLGLGQVVATVVSAIFTALAAFAAAAAAVSARKAVEVVPILEAAYPFLVIEEYDIEGPLLRGTTEKPDNGLETTRPMVKFSVKNYGNTPATVVDIEAYFTIATNPPIALSVQPYFFPQESMLATGDKTEVFETKLPLSLHTKPSLDIISGVGTLNLSGWVNYLDIWGRKWAVNFMFRYNPTLRRLNLVAHGRHEHKPDKNPPFHRWGALSEMWTRWQKRERSLA